MQNPEGYHDFTPRLRRNQEKPSFYFSYCGKNKEKGLSTIPGQPLGSDGNLRLIGFDAVLLIKTFHSTSCIHQFLLTGEKGMAAGTDFNLHIPDC